MRHLFPLFQSHLDLAYAYWSQIILVGDCVIDATCGNGHDTLKLSRLALSPEEGKVYSIDIQEEAINKTNLNISSQLESNLHHRVIFKRQCHSSFPIEIPKESVKLVVYNLGYLPGGDKQKTTELMTTLQSIQAALPLLKNGGALSITCYPGHAEGAHEQKELLAYASTLPPQNWSCCHHSWSNRRESPSLLLIQKKL